MISPSKQVLINLIDLENSRQSFIEDSDIQSLLMTYKIKTLSKNKNNSKFWDNEFSKAIIGRNYTEEDRNKTAAKWLAKLPASKIINVGCGDGKFEEYFLKRTKEPHKIDYQGIDFALKTIKSLRKRYPSYSFLVKDL